MLFLCVNVLFNFGVKRPTADWTYDHSIWLIDWFWFLLPMYTIFISLLLLIDSFDFGYLWPLAWLWISDLFVLDYGYFWCFQGGMCFLIIFSFWRRLRLILVITNMDINSLVYFLSVFWRKLYVCGLPFDFW